MNKGVVYTGVPSRQELDSAPGVPSRERMEKGPVACVECVQEIPCNPCEEACPFGAITIGSEITALPVLDEEKCTGCGVCIAQCPGLAIFTVDLTYGPDEAAVEFPYEYWPLPEAGDVAEAVDRDGKVVCMGRILRVRTGKNMVKTSVVQVAVPKEHADTVRSIKRLQTAGKE